MRDTMCRIRCFYEGFDGKLSWAEIVMSYEDDIAGMVKHWSGDFAFRVRTLHSVVLSAC